MIALRGALLASFVAALLVESASDEERKPLMIRSAEDANRVFGDSIEVLRRQADGSWRYVIDLPIGKE